MACGSLALSACSTLKVKSPENAIDVPANWALSEAAPAAVDLSKYWTLLGDPLLTDLVTQAIAENRDVMVGIARLDQARAGLRIARAGYLPTLSGTGGVRRDIGDLANDDLQFSVGADIAWEVDLFGQISGTVEASRADLAAAGYSVADIQRLIVGQVATQIVSARALIAQLEIARSTLVYQDDNLQLARWRNQAGLVSSLDVEQARTQRAQTAAGIPLLESNLAATANSISTLIGEPPGRVFELLTATQKAENAVPRPPLVIQYEAPAEVLRRRPDVRAAEANLAASAARIGVAKAALLPALRLSGTIGAGSTSLGNLLDVLAGNLFAGLTQLIFDGGRASARVDSAKAETRAALALYEQSLLDALEDVETSAVDQRTADERVAINDDALDAATNSAFLARSQYEAGLSDFQTLLVVENQLLAARNQLVAAQADRAVAFIRLTQALGGGWTAADYKLPVTQVEIGQDNRMSE